MITNDQLFWGFVVYDFVKSVLFLYIGVKMGFDYGIKHVNQFTEAAIGVK